MPLLVQIPGISVEWLAKQAVKRLDDRADLDTAIAAGMPSITAMNGITKDQATAEPPEAQGENNDKKSDDGRGPPSGVNPAPGDRAGGSKE